MTESPGCLGPLLIGFGNENVLSIVLKRARPVQHHPAQGVQTLPCAPVSLSLRRKTGNRRCWS